MLQMQDKQREPIAQAPKSLTQPDHTVLIFLGNSMVFSDRLLRTLEYEFKDVTAMRLRSVSDLDALDDVSKLATDLIIFDEPSMETYLRTRPALDPVYSGAGKVLAYSSAQTGRVLRQQLAGSSDEHTLRFLPMKSSLDAWFAALRLLLLGEAFVPAELLTRQNSTSAGAEPGASQVTGQADETAEKTPPPPALPNLTVREAEVLGLLATGMANKTIAEQLGLSEHTVKLHVHHIFGKLKVHNRVSATNWFLSHGQTLDRLQGR